jgi:hypothetical protein
MSTLRRRIGKPCTFGWLRIATTAVTINGTPVVALSWEMPDGGVVCLLADADIERLDDGSFIAHYLGNTESIGKPCR